MFLDVLFSAFLHLFQVTLDKHICQQKVMQIHCDPLDWQVQWKQDQSAASQSTQEADTLILINIFMDHQAE